MNSGEAAGTGGRKRVVFSRCAAISAASSCESSSMSGFGACLNARANCSPFSERILRRNQRFADSVNAPDTLIKMNWCVSTLVSMPCMENEKNAFDRILVTCSIRTFPRAIHHFCVWLLPQPMRLEPLARAGNRFDVLY